MCIQLDECHPIRLSIGVPETLRVWHDGKGFSPDWHLDTIVLVPRDVSDAIYYFHCGDWLSKATANEQTLRASLTNPQARTTSYEIVVLTSDMRGSGTDATVTLELFGSLGSSGPLILESPDIADPFERGQRDVFTMDSKSVGE